MLINKKIIIAFILLSTLIITLSYIKTVLLYHPAAIIPEKYEKFHQKLWQLVGIREYVSHVQVKSTDSILLDTVYLRNPESTKCIIYFHGNAGNIAMKFDMIKFLYNYCSVIAFDYRSYGKSTGNKWNLSSDGLFADARAVWNFARELGYHPNTICLYGESLGCSVAIHLAYQLSKDFDNRLYPHSLILMSPFYSLSALVEYYFNKLKAGLLARILVSLARKEYQSNEWIPYINHQTRIVIAHSPRDEIVPFQQGVNLYALISRTHQNAIFVAIAGTHNNIGLIDDFIYILADVFYE